MFGFFEGHAEKQFRKFIRAILIANVPDYEKMEGILPHSTVETAYRTAWLQIGKPAHGKRPSIYQEECAKAAEYIVDFYATAMRLLGGEDSAAATPSNRQPASAMDALTRMTYGDSPPPKRANLDEAVALAHTDLLFESIDLKELTGIATGLFNGPMPYSSHDLAVATAMNVFRNADSERRKLLEVVQLGARVELLNWITAGKVAPLIAKTFKNTLYEMFKEPAPPPVSGPWGPKPETRRSAPSRQEAATVYREAAIAKADEIFGTSWPWDPAWIGLMSVAADLDKIAGNTTKMDEITEKVLECFQNGKTSDYCGALLCIIHTTNQRELEDMMRQSKRGR